MSKKNPLHFAAVLCTLLSLLTPVLLKASSWSSTSELTGSSINYQNVSTCYDSANKKLIAVWTNNSDQANSATYSNGTWSAIVEITSDPVYGNGNICVCFDPTHQIAIAVWSGNSNYPVYSIYSETDGSWSWSTSMAIGGTSISTGEVNCCYDSKNNRIFATFIHLNSSNYPYYAIFNGTSWSGPTELAASTAYHFGSAPCCYDTGNDQLIVTWTDSGGGPFSSSRYPMYALLPNGSTTVSAQRMFSGLNTASKVFPIYNSTDKTIMALIADTTSGVNATYSLYPGGSSYWNTSPTQILSGVSTNQIIGCYVNSIDQILAT